MRVPWPSAGAGPRHAITTPDRALWGVWSASRLAALAVAAVGVRVLYDFVPDGPRQYTALWDRWDVQLFRKIAQHGYDGYPRDYPDRGIVSFFPGLPLLLRVTHVVVPGWTAAAMLVSAVASAVALRELARLAAADGAPPTLAASLLACSPWGVFLVAGYSEALFLALALPAWSAGRQRRWARAGLLCGAASVVRISGLFLFAGLVTAYLLDRPPPRARHLLLLCGPLGALGYFGYLWALTGDPLAWATAQSRVYHRSTTWPWTALGHTLELVTAPGSRWDFQVQAGLDTACVLAGVVVCAVLVRRRQLPEAVYLALTVTAFATSSVWYSVGRSTLLWWPAWLLLARALADRRRTAAVVLALSALAALTQTVLFVSGWWVG
ncbi:MAG: hypothetical protein JWM64_1677 [Frankiales bacterium]|nr:hypothetical protein [Frankiales bacterium]